MAKNITTKSKGVSKDNPWTWEDVQKIVEHPHLLGHLCGFSRLTEVHSEFIKRYYFSKDRIATMQLHRGAYKSTSMQVGAVLKLLLEPETTMIIVRRDYASAVDTIQNIHKMIMMPIVQQLFEFCHGELPKATVQKIGDGRVQYSFKKEASIGFSLLALGVGSSITGKHGNFVAIDDLETILSKNSKAERTLIRETVMELIGPVLDKGGHCGVCGTPWVSDEMGMWGLLPPAWKLNCYESGVLTQEEIAEVERITHPTLFAANYLLEIRAQGDCIFADPAYVDEWEVGTGGVYAVWDEAYAHDFNAISIMSRKSNGRLQCLGLTYRGQPEDWMSTVVAYFKKYHVSACFIETNTSRGWLAKELRKHHVVVKEYCETTKKDVKIPSALYPVFKNIDFMRFSSEEYMFQIVSYDPNGGAEFDDAPDSLASLVRAKFADKASERWKL